MKFEEWKQKLTDEINDLNKKGFVDEVYGKRCVLSGYGAMRFNMLKDFLAIANRCSSAAEAMKKIDEYLKADSYLADQKDSFVDSLREVVLMDDLAKWRDTLQCELNHLRAVRPFLNERGNKKTSVLLTFLNIADWSKSAAEAVEWIDGKHELSEDHRANLISPEAEPIIQDIRRIAEAEAKASEKSESAQPECTGCGYRDQYGHCASVRFVPDCVRGAHPGSAECVGCDYRDKHGYCTSVRIVLDCVKASAADANTAASL